ncbi:dispanin subfamily A member 2b-like isoform X1 [Carcharodon carcharias]|uniref:dispanin subfamily A member 2b-like isoform X1 n=1 Tax=Carcharodon carcharias TaxID=13397 RepID=UPI001B7E19CE|nr:dispanin subfamily A member 2b-like isoform X1 [Carcharodon carcharias]
MESRAEQVAMNPRSYPYQGQQQVQTTVVTMAPNVLPFRDHLLWSIFNFFYLNFCCLGFVALVFSVKSRDRKVVGDAEGARQYASTARALNIATTTLSILVFIIFFALLFAGIISLGYINQHRHSYAAGK